MSHKQIVLHDCVLCDRAQGKDDEEPEYKWWLEPALPPGKKWRTLVVRVEISLHVLIALLSNNSFFVFALLFVCLFCFDVDLAQWRFVSASLRAPR